MKQWLARQLPLLEAILTDLDTPVSLAVLIQLRAGEWDDLALKWVDPAHYPEGLFNAIRYARDVQAVDLLRKAPLPTTIDRRAAAMKAWEDAETQCYITNEFLQRISSSPSVSEDERRLDEFLVAVKNRMRRWLGPLPDSLDGGFGPGTCVEYEAANPTVVDKIWLTPTTTPSCVELFTWHFDQTLWGRSRLDSRLPRPGVSRGNRFTTVPKDGKVDRPISIEPVGNLWLQLGIGRLLKRKIRDIGLPDFSPAKRELFPGYTRCGRDAQSVHRDLLPRARRLGLSTIDLSSASDTLSLELVRRVLPPCWFQLLDDCRSKLTLVDGRWRHIEKFSSMGNGFTFELETLVFTALLSVAFGLTPGRDLWVFGDDIILPTSHFHAACRLLESVGFTPNVRKSYATGPFRESCGGNSHTDTDVTPVRLKGPLEDPAAVYAFHNALYHRKMFTRRTLSLVRKLIPRSLQYPGPERLGDVVLHGLPWKSRVKHGITSVEVLESLPSGLIPLERWSPELSVVALLLGSGTRVARRGGARRYRSRLASVS